MSGLVSVLFVVGLLTAVGSLALLVITVTYYWGERGSPPARGVQRRRQKQLELELRARQIEYSRDNPRQERSDTFFDNRKRNRGSNAKLGRNDRVS